MDLQEPLDNVAAPPRGRGFWRKLSTWLQPWKRAPLDPADRMLPDIDESALGRGSIETAWPRRRTSQMSRLEEGFDKMIGLVDTLDQHMNKQAEHGEQMIAQTRRLADSVGQAFALQKQRTEAVEEMANQYRTQTRQMQQVAEAVEALPRAIKNQGDTLGQVRDQLEAQLEAQLSTAQGVQKLATAGDTLRTLADEQRRHFQQLQESNQSANLQLATALERQGRRMSWLLGFAIAAAMLAIACSAAAVAFVLTRSH
jgi:exonuclease VII large subunit